MRHSGSRIDAGQRFRDSVDLGGETNVSRDRRSGREFWQQRESLNVAGAHDSEVPVIQSCDLIHSQALGECDY